MFDKSSQFQEQTQSSVKFHCKKFIMRQILHHLYGGKLEVSDCMHLCADCRDVRYVKISVAQGYIWCSRGPFKDATMYHAAYWGVSWSRGNCEFLELSCRKMKRKFLHNQSLNHHGRGGEGKVARPRRSHKKLEIVHFASGIWGWKVLWSTLTVVMEESWPGMISYFITDKLKIICKIFDPNYLYFPFCCT